MEEDACLVSYYLPLCHLTRQSILKYNGESSLCEHYRLPSIAGNVSSYHSFYNVSHCFITTINKEQRKLCHLWQVKFNKTAKISEERAVVRKSLLPFVVMQALIDGYDYQPIIIAYEV